MTRKKVIVEKVRDKKCLVCNRKWPSIKSLALHMAMMRDSQHAAWRKNHNLPADYNTRASAFKIAKKIEKILEEST